MRKFYRLLSIGFLITVAGVCASCVDTDYDFNKLDPEITVGGENLKINIGSTKQFRLGDIVSSFGGLSSGDDGSYGVSISTDPVNVSLCFSLSSGSDNARLNADNYIQASDLTLGLPGGFTFRFGK